MDRYGLLLTRIRTEFYVRRRIRKSAASGRRTVYGLACRLPSSRMGKVDFGSEATRRCSIGKWVQPPRSTTFSSFNRTWGKSASAVLSRSLTVTYWSELWRRGRDLGLKDSAMVF